MYNDEYFTWIKLGAKITGSDISSSVLEKIRNLPSFQSITGEQIQKEKILYNVAFDSLAFDHASLVTKLYSINMYLERGDIEEAKHIMKTIV